MKVRTVILAVFIVGLSLFYWGAALSQTEEPNDQTLSPYFFVRSDDPSTDRLPLKSTSAEVHISGVIADVRVTQVYKNEGKKPLEAIYIFPASTRAAVYGMKMQIGERTIEAKIKKREEARKEYEEARNQGKSASLLEQQRPNVFQMNVANIMPGDVIRVELKYTELLVPEDRIYEFVYPTVVGPRYSNRAAETAPPSEQWIQNPYLHQGQAPAYDFDIRVNLAAGLPVRDLSSPSHNVKASYTNASTARIELMRGDRTGGNRDYILRYRLDGKRIQSGLLLHEGEKENFFLLMMQPPEKIVSADIPGREYLFIVDVSGSMHGFPLDISKKLMADLVGNLRSSDRFNVLLFAGGSSLLSEASLPATSENIRKAISHIENQTGGGGTEILPALKRVLAIEKEAGISRSIVIATDGYVTVEEEVFDLIRKNLGQANLFAFGIGSSVNRHLIEGMARCGMGESFIITKPEESGEKAERFRKMIQSPVLTQVKVGFDGFDAYDVEPLSVPDVLGDRPVLVFGKWRGKADGKITLKGMTGKGKYLDQIDVVEAKGRKGNPALRYLWARHRITLLSDYNNLRTDEKRVREVTDLGLRYNLLTAYTSFVAVDTRVRSDGKPATAKQPLPLPQGVNDYAVGENMAKSYTAAMPAVSESLSGAFDRTSRSTLKVEEKGKETTKWTLKTLTFSAGMSKEETAKMVRRHLPELEGCAAGANLRGNLELRLVIDSDGAVSSVEVLSSAIRDAAIRKCLAEAVKKWRFPAIPRGRQAKVTVTIDMV